MKNAFQNRQSAREREIVRRLEIERYRTLIVVETLCLYAMNQEFHWKKKGLTRLWNAMVRYAADLRVNAQPDSVEERELGDSMWSKTCKMIMKDNTSFDMDAELKKIGIDVEALEDSVVDYDRKTGEIIFADKERKT